VQPLKLGIYRACLTRADADVAAALALRQLMFRTRRGLTGTQGDADRFDAICDHMLVTNTQTGALVGCCRVLRLASGPEVHRSYAAQFHDLTTLHQITDPLIELGRFCLHPDHSDPDILRLAWGLLTRLVDHDNARLLFGCTSFDGADPAPHRPALAWLARQHLRPFPCLAPERIDLAPLAALAPDRPPALPPLLRTYLAMGGWVSDHAVIDRDLNTLHVLTGLDVTAVPPARARALRALASLPHTDG
jgi:putative hemolysin